MNTTFNLKASLIVAALLSFSVAQAANLTKAEYKAEKTRISTEYKADKKACDALKANAKDVCVQEAKAKEKVALAEREFNYTGKAADQTKVLEAKAKSAYAVAKEKCDDQAGNAKDVCVKEAEAVEVKALADAKLGEQNGEAKKEASADKNNADYQVAIEKCNALADAAKDGCVAAAKAKFGKN
ncbi:MAG: hypothetical protein WBI05_08965 [Rhodoferax sp.]|uniref:hypothetical protein n=1 Tax=Rhodoferax sp. TaxID=50421 RepID=UPI003C751D86